METGWQHNDKIPTQSWTCGYCGREVSSAVGWAHVERRGAHGNIDAWVSICPRCDLPTVISDSGAAMPAVRPGENVEHVPEPIATLYDEARRALQMVAPTAAVMAGRKLLMNVAVAHDAPTGKTFAFYVDWLVEHDLVSAPMRDWVDEIRELGNEANHEIELMSEETATELLTFVAMLLRVVYEYPEKGRRSREARRQRDDTSNSTTG